MLAGRDFPPGEQHHDKRHEKGPGQCRHTEQKRQDRPHRRKLDHHADRRHQQLPLNAERQPEGQKAVQQDEDGHGGNIPNRQADHAHPASFSRPLSMM